MKSADVLWIIASVVIMPLSGSMIFGRTGLWVGLVLGLIFALLIYINAKPEKLDQAKDGAENYSKKMDSLTERIKADTIRRRGKKASHINCKTISQKPHQENN